MKPKQKILVLNYEYPPLGGGAANATKYLLREYADRKDIEVHLITSSVDRFRIDTDPFEITRSNVTIHYLDIGKNKIIHYQSNKDLLTYSWKCYHYAKKLMKEHNFDLTHAFFGIPCGYIAKRLGIPYIVSLRGSDVPFYNPRFKLLDTLLFQRMSRSIWKHSKATIANSQGLKDLALETAPDQDIGVIYNGVDVDEFAHLTHDYDLTTPLRILGVGRLIPRKGFDLLLKAIHNLPVEVILIGDGPERESLESYATEHNLPVTFTGAIDHTQIIEYYQNHDIFVLPSANEGMSNTVLEAMACGLPIITTDTGGTSELITDNGWVVPRTVEDLKGAIQAALFNREHLSTMGQISRKRVELMSWENVADQYVEEYQK